ncbi:MAG: beta-galactosidase [Planctomycetota bacterium]|nr:beta-galactosidase [Planctomycetota bacterium]
MRPAPPALRAALGLSTLSILAGLASGQATPATPGGAQPGGPVASIDAPIQAPRGIYCSCPPTNINSDSVMASVAQQPFVDGFLVRVSWSDFEPVRGQYDFSLIDRQLRLAEHYDKQIALALVQGSGTPAWLASEGAGTVSYPFAGQTRTIAAAWDATYQGIWGDTIAALGAAYDGHPRISLVHVTNATHNGFEMQLPLSQGAGFAAAGYTDAAYISSYEASLDAFAQAFPSHALDVELHPVFGSDAVAQAVLTYGLKQLGPRFGAFAAWWSVDNAQETYLGMYELLQTSAKLNFATVQVVGSWVKTPERFDNDLVEYLQTYSLALSHGVRYAEVWNADLLEPSLAADLTRVRAALLAQ